MYIHYQHTAGMIAENKSSECRPHFIPKRTSGLPNNSFYMSVFSTLLLLNEVTFYNTAGVSLLCELKIVCLMDAC